MTQVVHRYPLHLDTELRLPPGYRILRVGLRPSDKEPSVWILLDSNVEGSVKIHLRIFGTGHKIEHAAEYIGTFEEGPLVWHVFLMDPHPARCKGYYAPSQEVPGSGEMQWYCTCGVKGKFACPLREEFLQPS